MIAIVRRMPAIPVHDSGCDDRSAAIHLISFKVGFSIRLCSLTGTPRVTRHHSLSIVGVAIWVALGGASACEIRVRDSAFRVARDVHRLYVIAEPSDPSAGVATEQLRKWLDDIEGDLNLEVERVDANDPEFDWRSIGIPSAPPRIPVTVLVGRSPGTANSFVIDHWEPSPTADELSGVDSSPVRRRLANQLARDLAVLIYAPLDPSDKDDTINGLLSEIEKRNSDERIGVSAITLDRSDPEETLLCRFMGIRPDRPDMLCVAFGRGKMMIPPLIGDEITADNIHSLLSQIRQACSCSKPLSTMGVDLPLVWSEAIDSTVVLMDEELDLVELDKEVQNMLDAKADAASPTDTTQISIPPGRQPKTIHVEPNSARRWSPAWVGLGALAAIVPLVFVACRRITRAA